MKPTLYMNPVAEADVRKLRQAITETRGLLSDAAEKLRGVLGDETIMPETPLEVQAVMESAIEAIDAALRRLDSAAPAKRSSATPPPGGPTRQQGQFLAFIREYMMRNQAGVAPKVCRAWQQAVRDDFRDRFSPEHPVGPEMNEKIDLVDLQGRVAYKLKVSKNNTHFEFYRDIFKVAVHNHLHPDLPLTKLVFITPRGRGASPKQPLWLHSCPSRYSIRNQGRHRRNLTPAPPPPLFSFASPSLTDARNEETAQTGSWNWDCARRG